MKVNFTILIIFHVALLLGQDTSLVNVEHILKQGSTYLSNEEKLDYYDKLSGNYHHKDIVKSLEFAYKGLELAIQTKNQKYEAAFEGSIGFALSQYGLNEQALHHFERALDLNTSFGLTSEAAWRLVSTLNIIIS